MQQENFEQRLGDGLQRWANAGEPTLDLEGYVKAQRRAPRRWGWWVSVAAACVWVGVGVLAYHPTWLRPSTGPVASAPELNPLVKAAVLNGNAGLKWAYEHGLVHPYTSGPAEATVDGVTVHILSVVATDVRTDIIYQITGLPDSVDPSRSGGAGPDGRPIIPYPDIHISRMTGLLSMAQSTSPPIKRPEGLLGTITASPLEVESGIASLAISFGAQKVDMTLQISRQESAKLFRTSVMHETKQSDGIAVTVDSVLAAPGMTYVRYRVVPNSQYTGGVMSSPSDRVGPYLEVNGIRIESSDWITGGASTVGFSVPPGKAKFVVPSEVKGVPADLTVPFKEGATQETIGGSFTLIQVNLGLTTVDMGWSVHSTDRTFVGISELELVDAQGHTVPVDDYESVHTTPNGNDYEYTKTVKLPTGFTPVALHAKQIGVRVTGPWVFDLPTGP
jgi:hypothetical protein